MSAKLKGLLASNDSPVVGPQTARELAAWVELAEAARPAQATSSEIDDAVTMLSLALKDKGGVSREVAKARLALFERALVGVSGRDLSRGADKLLKTATFMPAPAELRSAALGFAAKREHAISRARYLLWKHRQDYIPEPAEPVPPDELKALLSDTREGLKP